MDETVRVRTNELPASVLQRQFLSAMPQTDPNVLNDIEVEAQYLAANIDNITENLCNLLHSVSSDQAFGLVMPSLTFVLMLFPFRYHPLLPTMLKHIQKL